MQRHAEKACDVVPIIVRAVNIEPEDADDLPFMKLQGLPTDLKAVTSWPNRDEAWTNVAKGLRATVNSIRARRPRPPFSPRVPSAPETTVRALVPHASKHGSIPAPLAASELADAALDHVVAGVIQQIDEAEIERSGRAVFDHVRHELVQETRVLIDLPDQKRVLWVDDRPENNRHETVALAKLQIEVIAVRSTGQALLRIAFDAQSGETFDLVLTDWTRPDDTPDAALALLTALRKAGHSMPVVIYHSESNAEHRAERAARGVAAGAMGEAVLPSELMRLVHQALSDTGIAAVPYDLLSAVAGVGGRGESLINYNLVTKRARSEVRAQTTQLRLVRELVQTASNDANSDRQIGRTLFQLLIPLEMQPFLGGTAEMLLELDSGTAGIPWELLDAGKRGGVDTRPWAIRSKLLRRLRTSEFREQPSDARADAGVLVIGEPRCTLARLPGARAEARAVLKRLAQVLPADHLRALISAEGPDQFGADAQTVVSALLERDWRIVHISGHGEAPDAPAGDGTVPPLRGVVLSDGHYLGPFEITKMRVVPELVFVNCCHLAAGPMDQLLQVDHPRFAAGVAQALIGLGVRCVVAAGWAVDDDAAQEFATAFYGALLTGQRFIDAVNQARVAAHGLGGNTWAAYQCYGDPEWSFLRREGCHTRLPGARSVMDPLDSSPASDPRRIS
jgi:CheY-like chemotaxis protein